MAQGALRIQTLAVIRYIFCAISSQKTTTIIRALNIFQVETGTFCYYCMAI